MCGCVDKCMDGFPNGWLVSTINCYESDTRLKVSNCQRVIYAYERYQKKFRSPKIINNCIYLLFVCFWNTELLFGMYTSSTSCVNVIEMFNIVQKYKILLFAICFFFSFLFAKRI